MMHTRKLVELASMVSAHGPALICDSSRILASGLEQYWSASKSRCDRWRRAMKQVAQNAPNTSSPERIPSQGSIRGVLEEIITGEILTRVWTAVLCAYDHRRENSKVELIARSILDMHMDARKDALALMVHGPGVDVTDAVALNRLRRRSERWADLLVGYLLGVEDVSHYAANPQRAKDFAEDLSYKNQQKGDHQAWPLLQDSLRAAFSTENSGLSDTSPNADLNGKIAAGILSCFPEDMFDATDFGSSLWMNRLMNTTADAQSMIDQLLEIG